MRTKINLGCAAAAVLSAGLMFFASFALAANPPMGADRHVAKGVTCNSCHGEDLKNPKFPDDATCTQCHNKDALAEKQRIFRVPILTKHLITEIASTAISSMSLLKITALSAINLTLTSNSFECLSNSKEISL